MRKKKEEFVGGQKIKANQVKMNLNTYNMEKMDRKSKEILENIINPKYTDIEKTLAIYKHINEKYLLR